jgi:hypothetical protein
MIVTQHYCTHRKGLIMTHTVFCKRCVKKGYSETENPDECQERNLHIDSKEAGK